MLGHPALFASHTAGNAQREALLAEQRVAAVAGADTPGQLFLRKVDDIAAHRVEITERMQAGNKIGGRAKAVGGDFAHARHDAHAGHYIGTVGSLDANLAERRIDWAHDIGHDVHGAATHSAVKESAYFVFGRARVHPVVRRTYIV